MPSRPGSDEARAAGDRAAQARGDQAEGGTRHPKKSRGLLREGNRREVRFCCKAPGDLAGGMVVWGRSVSRRVGSMQSPSATASTAALWVSGRSPLAVNVLNRTFEAPPPDRKLIADFTYVWTAEGWLYVVLW